MAKDYSGQCAQKLVLSVTTRIGDPRIEGRQVGWVGESASAYVREVRRIAVRCRKKNGQWGIGGAHFDALGAGCAGLDRAVARAGDG